jgi:outer membrane beta-barrel protein
MSNDFQDANTVIGKVGYFFLEEWGFELLYGAVSNKDSDTLKAVSFQPINVVPFIRKIQDYYGASLLYSPFYAKLNTFNTIFYLDWSFGAGVVKLNTKSNRDAFKAMNGNLPYKDENFTGYLLQTELRVYLTDYMNFNINWLRVYFQDKAPTNDQTQLFHNTDLVFSLGFNI